MQQMSGELQLNQLMRSLLHSMMDGIDESQLYEQPSGGGNSPGWILGHLVVVNRFGYSMLGGSPPDPRELAMFGPGSSADMLSLAGCPSKQQLMDMEQETAEALRRAVAQADPEALDSAQPSPFFREALPRVRDMLAHILVSHLSMHVGQLSAWRRARGLESVLQINPPE